MASRSQVVLVTGASSRIGRPVAGAFGSKGFTVFGTSRKPAQAAPWDAGSWQTIPSTTLTGSAANLAALPRSRSRA
jgi:NAD(P)-dependent dehydrogenase (short-subunit alcohol dehydrogenase family)